MTASEPDPKDAAQAHLLSGPQPGEHYRHWKGGLYVVVARSVQEDTLEQLVTYRSLAKGGTWTRTLANFTERVPLAAGPPLASAARFERC